MTAPKPASRNRMWNVKNRCQGDTKKILAVCSAGLLRSPTIAHILSSPPFNFNTRAAGIVSEYALIPVDDALIMWADEIIVVDIYMIDHINDIVSKTNWGTDFNMPIIRHWDIPDIYNYGDLELKSIIQEKAFDTYRCHENTFS